MYLSIRVFFALPSNAPCMHVKHYERLKILRYGGVLPHGEKLDENTTFHVYCPMSLVSCYYSGGLNEQQKGKKSPYQRSRNYASNKAREKQNKTTTTMTMTNKQSHVPFFHLFQLQSSSDQSIITIVCRLK